MDTPGTDVFVLYSEMTLTYFFCSNICSNNNKFFAIGHMLWTLKTNDVLLKSWNTVCASQGNAFRFIPAGLSNERLNYTDDSKMVIVTNVSMQHSTVPPGIFFAHFACTCSVTHGSNGMAKLSKTVTKLCPKY